MHPPPLAAGRGLGNGSAPPLRSAPAPLSLRTGKRYPLPTRFTPRTLPALSKTTRARHQALRTTLTDIAERRIEEGGIERIKARDLAAEAGCSVGAIYTVFEDLTELVIAVNGRTFHALGTAVSQALAADPGASPQDQLVIMGHAYLHFAAEHPRLWRTLFDLEMSADQAVPAWYLEELGKLFALIAAPLRELHPDADPAFLDKLTRTLFSSVHGIVLLGLERRISGVPMAAMEEMTALLLRNVAALPDPDTAPRPPGA